jgi:hypothetical protein
MLVAVSPRVGVHSAHAARHLLEDDLHVVSVIKLQEAKIRSRALLLLFHGSRLRRGSLLNGCDRVGGIDGLHFCTFCRCG